MDKIFSIASIGAIASHYTYKDNLKTTIDLYPNKVVVESLTANSLGNPAYTQTISFSMQHISEVTVFETGEYIELYINKTSLCAFTKTDVNRANVKKFVELLENIF